MGGSIRGCGMSEVQALGLGPVPARPARRLRRNRTAVAAAVVIVALALLAIVGPWLSPYSYDALDW
jgi:ABC-type dipeptide/oligopeptide/nickel transport system permease subunit